MRYWSFIMLGVLGFAAFACNLNADSNSGDLPDPQKDLSYQPASESEDQSEPSPKRQVVLAGGCFWCVEAVFEPLKGVDDVVSGYAGDSEQLADYKIVSTGNTQHAEVVRITYDPGVISYGDILKIFFSTHDPTTPNRQGGDVGPQYRSAIFYASDQEREVAQAYIDQLNEAKVFADPIVTTLEPLKQFFEAEAYHQDYARNNPNQGYIRAVAKPKVEKVKKKFKDKLKEAGEDGGK